MDIVHVGCPIRKSTDQWIFAPPRGLSQLVTSFVGSWCQGIPLALFLAWPIKNKINLVLVVNYAGFTDCFLWNCNRYPSIRCSTIKITSCSVLFQAQTSLLPYLSLSITLFSFQGAVSNFVWSQIEMLNLLSTSIQFQLVVEITGIEPVTSCLQGRRSPSWANPP